MTWSRSFGAIPSSTFILWKFTKRTPSKVDLKSSRYFVYMKLKKCYKGLLYPPYPLLSVTSVISSRSRRSIMTSSCISFPSTFRFFISSCMGVSTWMGEHLQTEAVVLIFILVQFFFRHYNSFSLVSKLKKKMHEKKIILSCRCWYCTRVISHCMHLVH